MIKSIQSIFKIPDLKNRILFTLGILILYRIGCHIPTPGINADALAEYFAQSRNTLFGLYDMFAGGAFSKAAIFGLGIMPYISASIIIQLLGAVVPYFQRLQKEGEEGRKKINQLTRYGTVFIASMQAMGASLFLENLPITRSGIQAVSNPGMGFRLLVMITMMAGTMLVMWLGEQITERGLGNGISLIIFTGIIVRFPTAILDEIQQLIGGNRHLVAELFIFGILFLIIASVVLLTEGTRKIPVQYAKRVVGRKIYGGQATFIPIRVSGFGVMAIIFANSLMFVPQTIGQFFTNSEIVQTIVGYFDMSSPVYWFFLGILILFFTYFYAAIAFNPVDVADNMQKQGGFIPGVRPGKKTAEYIDHVLSRVMFPAAVFFALIAIFPYFVSKYLNVSPTFSQFFGGTSLLIMVGVSLDTLQQIESHLLMRHYDGFMKTGRIRGRR
ncbi:preprotein translocase subunit SecY [candidate division KSB1 bacterium]|nr:preprotein translocase subunit SecY [candidate division KSB1 bacterium]